MSPGTPTDTSPAPDRTAAEVHTLTAPVYPTEPPKMSTLP